jgi:hypothetical protein
MTDDMDQNSQSYVVKIWVEEANQREDTFTWAGHITQVNSGNRKYVSSLREITDYFKKELAVLSAQ